MWDVSTSYNNQVITTLRIQVGPRSQGQDVVLENLRFRV